MLPVARSGSTPSALRRYADPGIVRHLRAPNPLAVFSIAFCGAAIGLLVLYADWRFPANAKPFTSTGEYRLWVALVCAQTALWAVALLPLADSLRPLCRLKARECLLTLATASPILIGLLVVGWISFKVLPDRQYPLPDHETKLVIIVGLGSLVALVGGLGMAVIHRKLVELARADLKYESERRRAAVELLALRDRLQRLLGIEGAIIGAAVLATAALRNAVLAFAAKVKAEPLNFPDVTAPTFPPEDVLIYGAAFSLLLALFWAPIFQLQIAAGERLRDAMAPSPSAGEAWSEWIDRRRKLDEILGLKATASASFRSGVAILTPLLGGLLGLLF